jgi:hypothetical protein
LPAVYGKGSVELLAGLIGWGHHGSGFRQPHGLMLQHLTAFRSRLVADGTTWQGEGSYGTGEHDKAR